MKIILSPSKTQHFKNDIQALSEPLFLEKTKEIVDELKKLSVDQLKSLYDISDKLAEKVHFMIHHYNKPHAAIGYYKGEAYRYLDALHWSDETRFQAQQSLRILCAQHGVLRPYDAILPYRMDFLVNFDHLGLENAYLYWSDSISEALVNEMNEGEILFNLASKEFSSAIHQTYATSKVHWINVDFHLIKNNQSKTVSMLAKKARGMMAKALLENPIEDMECLFDLKQIGEFLLDEQASSPTYLRYVFIKNDA